MDERPDPLAKPGPTKKSDQEILALRARSIAKARDDSEGDLSGEESVEFLLGKEHYALELSIIQEIAPIDDITPIPGTPLFIKGVINIRGEIFSVVDLKQIFELPIAEETGQHYAILLRSRDMEFCLLVDGILGVRRILADSLEPPPPTLTGMRADYLIGIASGNILFLDGIKLLASPLMVIEQETFENGLS